MEISSEVRRQLDESIEFDYIPVYRKSGKIIRSHSPVGCDGSFFIKRIMGLSDRHKKLVLKLINADDESKIMVEEILSSPNPKIEIFRKMLKMNDELKNLVEGVISSTFVVTEIIKKLLEMTTAETILWKRLMEFNSYEWELVKNFLGLATKEKIFVNNFINWFIKQNYFEVLSTSIMRNSDEHLTAVSKYILEQGTSIKKIAAQKLKNVEPKLLDKCGNENSFPNLIVSPQIDLDIITSNENPNNIESQNVLSLDHINVSCEKRNNDPKTSLCNELQVSEVEKISLDDLHVNGPLLNNTFPTESLPAKRNIDNVHFTRVKEHESQATSTKLSTLPPYSLLQTLLVGSDDGVSQMNMAFPDIALNAISRSSNFQTEELITDLNTPQTTKNIPNSIASQMIGLVSGRNTHISSSSLSEGHEAICGVSILQTKETSNSIRIQRKKKINLHKLQRKEGIHDNSTETEERTYKKSLNTSQPKQMYLDNDNTNNIKIDNNIASQRQIIVTDISGRMKHTLDTNASAKESDISNSAYARSAAIPGTSTQIMNTLQSSISTSNVKIAIPRMKTKNVKIHPKPYYLDVATLETDDDDVCERDILFSTATRPQLITSSKQVVCDAAELNSTLPGLVSMSESLGYLKTDIPKQGIAEELQDDTTEMSSCQENSIFFDGQLNITALPDKMIPSNTPEESNKSPLAMEANNDALLDNNAHFGTPDFFYSSERNLKSLPMSTKQINTELSEEEKGNDTTIEKSSPEKNSLSTLPQTNTRLVDSSVSSHSNLQNNFHSTSGITEDMEETANVFAEKDITPGNEENTDSVNERSDITESKDEMPQTDETFIKNNIQILNYSSLSENICVTNAAETNIQKYDGNGSINLKNTTSTEINSSTNGNGVVFVEVEHIVGSSQNNNSCNPSQTEVMERNLRIHVSEEQNANTVFNVKKNRSRRKHASEMHIVLRKRKSLEPSSSNVQEESSATKKFKVKNTDNFKTRMVSRGKILYGIARSLKKLFTTAEKDAESIEFLIQAKYFLHGSKLLEGTLERFLRKLNDDTEMYKKLSSYRKQIHLQIWQLHFHIYSNPENKKNLCIVKDIIKLMNIIAELIKVAPEQAENDVEVLYIGKEADKCNNGKEVVNLENEIEHGKTPNSIPSNEEPTHDLKKTQVLPSRKKQTLHLKKAQVSKQVVNPPLRTGTLKACYVPLDDVSHNLKGRKSIKLREFERLQTKCNKNKFEDKSDLEGFKGFSAISCSRGIKRKNATKTMFSKYKSKELKFHSRLTNVEHSSSESNYSMGERRQDFQNAGGSSRENIQISVTLDTVTEKPSCRPPETILHPSMIHVQESYRESVDAMEERQQDLNNASGCASEKVPISVKLEPIDRVPVESFWTVPETTSSDILNKFSSNVQMLHPSVTNVQWSSSESSNLMEERQRDLENASCSSRENIQISIKSEPIDTTEESSWKQSEIITNVTVDNEPTSNVEMTHIKQEIPDESYDYCMNTSQGMSYNSDIPNEASVQQMDMVPVKEECVMVEDNFELLTFDDLNTVVYSVITGEQTNMMNIEQEPLISFENYDYPMKDNDQDPLQISLVESENMPQNTDDTEIVGNITDLIEDPTQESNQSLTGVAAEIVRAMEKTLDRPPSPLEGPGNLSWYLYTTALDHNYAGQFRGQVEQSTCPLQKKSIVNIYYYNVPSSLN